MSKHILRIIIVCECVEISVAFEMYAKRKGPGQYPVPDAFLSHCPVEFHWRDHEIEPKPVVDNLKMFPILVIMFGFDIASAPTYPQWWPMDFRLMRDFPVMANKPHDPPH